MHLERVSTLITQVQVVSTALWARVLVTLCLAVAGLGVTSLKAEAVGSFDNGAVATAAEQYANSAWGGQCKQFANNAIKSASGNTINLTGYQQGYANAGGVEVSSANAVRGDIIQVTPNGSVDSNVEWYYDQGYTALHTAIVLANYGGGNFSVIDSNWGNNSLVQRHSFNPYSWAASKPGGGIVKIWRMGTVSSGGSGTSPVGTRLVGDVNGDGKSDAVVMFRDTGTAMVALSNGSSFTTPTSWAAGHTVGAEKYFLKDVNGDGMADLVAFWKSIGM